MMGLTAKQAAVLDAIESLTVDGVSPSFEEIRVRCGFASKGGVHRCVEALVERGAIRRCFGRARALEVVGRDPLDGLTADALLALRRSIDARLEAMA